MKVRRIVANIDGKELDKAEAFYGRFLGLDVLMDHGWIKTFGSDQTMALQVSIASQGGSGTLVPDLSVEVDDLPAALQKARELGISVEYGPANEPWGVRRFYVRDPFGKLVNVLQHR